MGKGKLYLIPTYLSGTNNRDNITNAVKNVICKTSYYLVENVRTARRYLASLQLGLDIEIIHFESMDKHFDVLALPKLLKPLLAGENMGILSEAGLPAIADPGNLAVRYAHQEDIEVVCLEGASSIILGLISSGLNGQQFTFHGYLPIDPVLREKKIRTMEQIALSSGYSQVFMETPYRNQQLLTALCKVLRPDTILAIGADLTGQEQCIRSKKISVWKKGDIKLAKIPCIFSMGFY
jgi:16S rRNA (cytidine1402-2'-O)-methyltransferase